ncbi:MAG: hypothetical protein ABR865_13155 [Terracidiphilus sp.]
MKIWNSLRIGCALLVLSNGNLALGVKTLKLDIPKDQAIVVEAPPDQWVVKETSWTEGIPISVLRADGDFIKSKRWEDGSLPLLADFHIERAQDCGSGVMSGRIVGCPPNWKQIELRSARAWLKIQFPPEVLDVEEALKEIAFIGSVAQFEETSYLHDKVFLPNQAKLFDALPKLNEEGRYTFFKLGVAKGFDVSSESFKGIGYLEVRIPATTTFNTARVSQDERVSEVIRETILPEAKEFLAEADGKQVDGIAFHLSIPAYNFVTGGEAKFDDLLVYFANEELKKFSEDDITSQNLLDNSIVLLNHDRIEVKL